jgi:UPF0716 protein FxsA
VAIVVGRLIGGPLTLLLLLALTILGFVVVRVQGTAAWRSLNASLAAGRPPSADLSSRALRVVAGLLLVVPGFLSDVVALVLLVPVTRNLVRRRLERRLRQAADQRVTLLPPGFAGLQFNRFNQGDVVEGEVVAEDDRPDRPDRP